LRDEDLVGIVLCKRAGEEPTSWKALEVIHYAAVGDLRSAFAEGRVVAEKPKGAEEAFELRVTWPSSVATRDGTVSEVSSSAIKYKRFGGGTTSLRLFRKGIPLRPLVSVGDQVHAGQVVASVVPVRGAVTCDKRVGPGYYLGLLRSVDLSDRYTACKALTHFGSPAATSALMDRQSDGSEHIYVRLEAAAGLMRRGNTTGTDFVRGCLGDTYLQNRLEAVIILGEIKNGASLELLVQTLRNPEQNPEIRAGAAYSLGELGSRESLEALVEVFLSVDERIRVEAARSLAKLGQQFPEELAGALPRALPDQRAGIAWALSRSRAVPVRRLMENLVDEDARQWIAYILGTQEPAAYVEEVEELRDRDPEVYFATTVLWKILSSWINGLEEY
jgi:HEAT repeat protein